MSFLNEIRNFLEDYTDLEAINPNVDINRDLGVDGDDFDKMMDKYSKNYEIDMANYRWYFHSGEEAWNPGNIFFKAPYQRVDRIPVTPTMLAKFIPEGKWGLEYPPNHLPENRYDLLINRIISAIMIIVVGGILIYKYTR